MALGEERGQEGVAWSEGDGVEGGFSAEVDQGCSLGLELAGAVGEGGGLGWGEIGWREEGCEELGGEAAFEDFVRVRNGSALSATESGARLRTRSS